MSVEDESLKELRAQFEELIRSGGGESELEASGLRRFRTDDHYAGRFLKHHEGDPVAAAAMVKTALIWRATRPDEKQAPAALLRSGAFFPRGRDVDGRALLAFNANSHSKGQNDFEDIKRCIVYWLERMYRQEHGEPISMFFNLEGAGLSNLDMELIKYMIDLFKFYYPSFLNYIIIFEMPWVLSAAFKVIKQLLPAKAVAKMKFVNKSNLKDYVTPDQALIAWGGTDAYEFVFEPENDGEGDAPPKKVTFADAEEKGECLISVKPRDVITFAVEGDDVTGRFSLQNCHSGAVSFKIRTTVPEKFRVRPSAGCLEAGASQAVVVALQPGYRKGATRDRFLVMAAPVSAPLGPRELTELWQSMPPSVEEHRLKCVYPEDEAAQSEKLSKLGKQSVSYVNANSSPSNDRTINARLRRIELMQFVVLIISVATAAFAYLSYSSTHNDSYSGSSDHCHLP